MNNENKEINQNNEVNNEQKDYADKTIETVEKIMNTPDLSSNFSKEEIDKNKTSAILCYLNILFLIPILKGEHKRSKYVLFHVNQGLTLFLTQIAIWFVTSIITSIFYDRNSVIPSTPGWISFINTLLWAGVLALVVTGLINTINGKSKELPVIGKYKLIK